VHLLRSVQEALVVEVVEVVEVLTERPLDG
jgi:hypothetical protein